MVALLPPATYAQYFRHNEKQAWTGHQVSFDGGSTWLACHTSQALEWRVLEFAATLTPLAYSALSFGAVTLHRRLPWFRLPTQALHVLPLFALAHLLSLAVRMLVGGMWPGWALLLAPFVEAALWPLASALLLAPQRRAPDRDAHRPL